MSFVNSTQRSSAIAAAIASSVAAVSVCAAAVGPLSQSSAWHLAASSLPAEIAATVHDVLVATRAAVQADRGDIVTARHAIRDTRQDAGRAIGASILSGSVGDGQIKEITSTAGATIDTERQLIVATRGDIHQTRQTAAGDIRTIVADNHDGSTVQAIRAILDTAQMENAMTRSAIAADAAENKTVRRSITSDVVALRRSARAGEITKAEAAQQISAERRSAHEDVAANRAQMVSSHKEITATRVDAAKDVANAVRSARGDD